MVPDFDIVVLCQRSGQQIWSVCRLDCDLWRSENILTGKQSSQTGEVRALLLYRGHRRIQYHELSFITFYSCSCVDLISQKKERECFCHRSWMCLYGKRKNLKIKQSATFCPDAPAVVPALKRISPSFHTRVDRQCSDFLGCFVGGGTNTRLDPERRPLLGWRFFSRVNGVFLEQAARAQETSLPLH